MRSQIGKRAKKQEEKHQPKTLSREFVENNLRKSISIREEYLVLNDVKTAININAVEQRILARNNVLKLLRQKITSEKLIEIIEEQNHYDRHRMTRLL